MVQSAATVVEATAATVMDVVIMMVVQSVSTVVETAMIFVNRVPAT